MASCPSVAGVTNPSSSATVTVPMGPWPHMGRQPLVSMDSTPMSQSSRDDGYRIDPDIPSWPRGSNISVRRTQSCSARKIWRFSATGTCGSSGAPPATTRTGLPQVWASTQKKVWGCMVSRTVRCRRG